MIQIPTILNKTIAGALGRPLTPAESTVLYTVHEITPAHHTLARELATLNIGLCGEYLTAAVKTWEPYVYANYLERLKQEVNREKARSIDPSSFQLAPVQRILHALRNGRPIDLIAEMIELDTAETYAVQNAIVDTMRCQLGTWESNPGNALLTMLGSESFERLLQNIAGNIVQILL